MIGQSYRAGTIKRRRRTTAEVDQLDQQIIDVLREDNPQSVRHVFYRMTDPRLPAHILRAELRACIEAFLPQGALAVIRVAEESERQHLLRMAEMMEGRA